MEDLIISSTEDTPGVKLLLDGRFEFQGKSLPENVLKFYTQIFDWLNKFYDSNSIPVTVNFKLEYFNTSSSKIILDIFVLLEERNSVKENIKINWHYKKDDEDMLEAGEEFADLVELPFEMIEF